MKSIYDYKETIDSNLGVPVSLDFRGEEIEIAAVKRGYMLRFVKDSNNKFRKPKTWEDLVCMLDMGTMIMGFEKTLMNLVVPFMTEGAKKEYDDAQSVSGDYKEFLDSIYKFTYPYCFYVYWGERDGQQIQVVDHKLDRISKAYDQDCNHCNVSLTSIHTVRGGHCYDNSGKFLYDYDDFHGQLN